MAQSEAELILRTLDGFLTGPARIRLLGGAALVLGYGMPRTTEDADLLEDIRYLIEHEHLTSDQVRAAVSDAIVPPIFADVFPVSIGKLESMLRSL